jgi:cellulose synthase/poly-beta-1,6-N-acetylglucosamine synthase-like glycosyltransferase
MIAFIVLVVLLSGVLAIVHLGQLAAVAMAALERRTQRALPRRAVRAAAAGTQSLPGVSVLLQAADAAQTMRAVAALLEQRYPDLEVIVVVDSADSTVLDALWERFDLQPADPRPRGEAPTEHVRAVLAPRREERLLVVDKRGDDRADALNAALNVATRPLIMTCDIGARLEAHTIADAAVAFVLDPATVVASASTLLRDARSGSLAAQLWELQMARRTTGALALSRLDAVVDVAATATLFSRRAVVDAGGFQPRAPRPEREITLRLHAALRAAGTPYRIVQSANAIAHEPVAASWDALGRRETERQRSAIVALGLHGRALSDRRLGALASIAVPYAVLELAAPVVEAVAWLLVILGLTLGLLPWHTVLLFLSSTIGLGFAVSLAVLVADVAGAAASPSAAHTAQRAGLSLLEQTGPRQLGLWWRLRAWLPASPVGRAS